MSDRAGLLALWLDLIEHHRCLDPDYPDVPGSQELLLGEIERGLRTGSCRLAVAEESSELVGFIFIEVGGRALLDEGGQGSIHELFVAPAWRRKGLGRALVGFADGFFKERGAESVSVRIETSNAEAYHFWFRLGFGERARVLTRETGTERARGPVATR